MKVHPGVYQRQELDFTIHGMEETDVAISGEAYMKGKNLKQFTKPSDSYL
jgi:hypothetical protein